MLYNRLQHIKEVRNRVKKNFQFYTLIAITFIIVFSSDSAVACLNPGNLIIQVKNTSGFENICLIKVPDLEKEVLFNKENAFVYHTSHEGSIAEFSSIESEIQKLYRIANANEVWIEIESEEIELQLENKVVLKEMVFIYQNHLDQILS